MTAPTLCMPFLRCTNPAFRYTPAASTDVTRTWARFGWSPVQRGAAQ